ncbi:MAG: carbamoyltransferase HypF [Deltaproteobacteria bacterium]|nr:carbamoyltransferase HypF [Deltaproteobacteria bacterium]
MPEKSGFCTIVRKRILIEGVVQGVGFRPFVYRIAMECRVSGWVLNDGRGVSIEAEGAAGAVERFIGALREEAPPLASISSFEVVDLPVRKDSGFQIRESLPGESRVAQISPDTDVCPDCLRELFSPQDRRFRYPFINCTNCGPRYSIVTGIPYDRPKTTMSSFVMCPPCRDEYENPASRRFHAQPNACPDCGPSLQLYDAQGQPVERDDLIATVAGFLKQGKIVAIKGLGGYHLAVNATDDEAVAELRKRKARDEKPFALMASDVEKVASFAEVSAAEKSLLESVERPIVLLHQKKKHGLSPLIAPRNRFFGVMLPYTPLHYLLLQENFQALVMTSGNLSEEPIAFEDGDARQRLSDIADYFLVHNRDIHTRTDDSIIRVMSGRPLVLRRSRGYVPRSVFLPRSQTSVLAVGAELKNTVCFTKGDQAILSHHIGDLKNQEVFSSFEKTIGHLGGILETKPEVIAYDMHPDYYSAVYAADAEYGVKIPVQHHHAHLASCLAENNVEEEAIGVIFDGTGYGTDGHIWGGEFLTGNAESFERAGHFAYLPMPGGDAATQEPYRMALSYLYRAFGKNIPVLPFLDGVPGSTIRLLQQMMDKGVNSPMTSSCGRLFDAVGALVGLRQKVSYEGQAALELEMAISVETEDGSYPFSLVEEDGMMIFEPSTLIRAIVEEVQSQEDAGRISARFHNTLALMVLEACKRIRERTGLAVAALSGGVFQNLYLTEKTLAALEEGGFRVLTHSVVPPNDGGLALGQAVIAGRQVARLKPEDC